MTHAAVLLSCARGAFDARATGALSACFPPGGKHGKESARPAGVAAAFVRTLLDSALKSVRIMGTRRATSAFADANRFTISVRRHGS